MSRLRKSAISCFAVEMLVLQLPHLTHDEDGFWERLQLEVGKGNSEPNNQ